MPAETLPDTTSTFWFDYFRWPRAAKPAAPTTACAPRKTYREALLSNMPVVVEQDALLHETYLFV
jgi:hypothetical protein